MSKSDGGSAFPLPALESQFAVDYAVNYGMTLRDYFAAASLMGVTANSDYDFNHLERARFAYAAADAMLAKRDASSPS